MTNADTMSAVLGLLLGLATHHPPLVAATADAAPIGLGPAVAIGKAKAAAGVEADRAHESDAEAARIFAPSEGPARDGASANGVVAAPPVPAAQAPQPQAQQVQAPGGEQANTAAPMIPSGAVAPGGPQAGPDAAAVAAALPAAVEGGKYDPSVHRDPFRPPNLASAVADTGTPRTPLEGYELGQLKLVGIVRDAGTARAMVEDSAGLGYIVTSGTPIGSSGGIVRTIETRRVLIDETTTNFYGEKQAKEVVMELPQEDRSP
jgi:Tfp pilus assembly protein PilP